MRDPQTGQDVALTYGDRVDDDTWLQPVPIINMNSALTESVSTHPVRCKAIWC